MILENRPGSPPGTDEIEAFLADFGKRCESFGARCEAHARNELGLDDLTRSLSEATAEAENAFARCSPGMSLEQLQRYGSLQSRLDSLTFGLFETEIRRNRAIMLDALRKGDYFIVNLTFGTIRSSIYMMFAKQKIKTEQEAQLTQLDTDQEASRSLIKVLKAIEGMIRVGCFEELDYAKLQKVLEIYLTFFRQGENSEIKRAGDERVFALFEEHVEFLRSMGFGGDPSMARVHLDLSCDLLQRLVHNPRQTMLLAAWRSLLG